MNGQRKMLNNRNNTFSLIKFENETVGQEKWEKTLAQQVSM